MAFRRWAQSFANGSVAARLERLNARHPWSHNDHFHSWILANLPERRRSALDVGCGRGELLAALAPHFAGVHGADADAAMRAEATRRCSGHDNVAVREGDWTDSPGPFDLVTMIAVLHHLDVANALRDVRRLLAPNGKFLAVGLAVPRNLRDHAWDVASAVTNPIIGYVKHPWPSPSGKQPAPFPVRDPTQTFDELRTLVDTVMPGAKMRHQLGFRHTIAWTNPG
ncbi:class I SAM-dependent methyltransferase [Kribbella sp. NPDC004536]|uniref:class I SAM-dependent methyltransferase n=1 Tax=Kribbella sp. NPDC004536 TaxID=3364106 RepID=UPI00367DEAB1